MIAKSKRTQHKKTTQFLKWGKKLATHIQNKFQPRKEAHKGQEFAVFMLTMLIIAIFFSVSYYNLPFLAKYWDYLVQPENLKLYLAILICLFGIAFKIHYEQHRKQKKRFKFIKPIRKTKKK